MEANSEALNQELIQKVRSAVAFCKKETNIVTFDSSKLSDYQKESIEQCLNSNYLKENPKFFGNRQTVFLDLY